MNSRGAHEYQVEFYIRSDLKSHRDQSFTFAINDAQVTILSASSDADSEGFVAQVALSDSSALQAQQGAHDILTKVLDILCYEMGVPGLITRNVRTQIEDAGEVRRCVVYGYEHRNRHRFLMKPQADEISRILLTPLNKSVQRALYWLRWSYCARTLPEAFLFVWMAIERLVGEEKRQSLCPKCKKPMKCEDHGENSFSSVSRDRIREFLERHQMRNIKSLLKIRDPLVHGSLAHNFAHRVIMRGELPKLSKAVEDELRMRLAATFAVGVSPFSAPGDFHTSFQCEYRTSFPNQRFPSDCPSFAEADRYFKMSDKRNHSKIIAISSGLPAW